MGKRATISRAAQHGVGTARRLVGPTAAALLLSLAGSRVANAHVFVAPTHLTIHVKDSAVSGMLVGRPDCRGGQIVNLIVDDQPIDSTTTDSKGRYAFSFTPEPRDRIQTTFGGSQKGPHPHRHECLPSSSRVVSHGRVAVLGESGSRTIAPAGPGAASAFTGGDVRAPTTVLLVALILGVSSLFIVRRRSG